MECKGIVTDLLLEITHEDMRGIWYLKWGVESATY